MATKKKTEIQGPEDIQATPAPGASVEVTLNRPTLFTMPDGTVLVPGPDQDNRITLKQWDAMKGNKVVRAWLREGAIEVDGSGVEIPTVPSPQKFRQLKKDEAITLVRACDDAAQIQAWVAADPRKVVRQASQQRLVELQAAGNGQAKMGERIGASQRAVDSATDKGDGELNIVTQEEIDRLGSAPK